MEESPGLTRALAGQIASTAVNSAHVGTRDYTSAAHVAGLVT
jgi:hypothetical protein